MSFLGVEMDERAYKSRALGETNKLDDEKRPVTCRSNNNESKHSNTVKRPYCEGISFGMQETHPEQDGNNNSNNNSYMYMQMHGQVLLCAWVLIINNNDAHGQRASVRLIRFGIL